MNERDMMHGRDWTGEDVTGWYITEKMDGVRAYWDGRNLWTRGGNLIYLPHLTCNLPAVSLDGEIWAGRGGFETARISAQYGKRRDDVRFVAFDSPSIDAKYLTRLNHARSLGVECVDIRLCKSMEHLQSEFDRVKSHGGEGLIAYAPDARYVRRRCGDVLKIKQPVLEPVYG